MKTLKKSDTRLYLVAALWPTAVLYDTPREVRHPDEYDGENNERLQKLIDAYDADGAEVEQLMDTVLKGSGFKNDSTASSASGEGLIQVEL